LKEITKDRIKTVHKAMMMAPENRETKLVTCELGAYFIIIGLPAKTMTINDRKSDAEDMKLKRINFS